MAQLHGSDADALPDGPINKAAFAGGGGKRVFRKSFRTRVRDKVRAVGQQRMDGEDEKGKGSPRKKAAGARLLRADDSGDEDNSMSQGKSAVGRRISDLIRLKVMVGVMVILVVVGLLNVQEPSLERQRVLESLCAARGTVGSEQDALLVEEAAARFMTAGEQEILAREFVPLDLEQAAATAAAASSSTCGQSCADAVGTAVAGLVRSNSTAVAGALLASTGLSARTVGGTGEGATPTSLPADALSPLSMGYLVQLQMVLQAHPEIVALRVDESTVLQRNGRRSELRDTEIVEVYADATTPAVDPAVGSAWLRQYQQSGGSVPSWEAGPSLALARRISAWAEFDDSRRVRTASIWQFVQTNAIILLLAVQAALLTRDVHRLLVRPIERLAEHLRPVLSDAIRFLSEDGNRWNVEIGKQDGEELSTKLMLAAIESLRSQMKDDAKKRFDRKSLFHGLRRQSAKVGGMKTMFEGLHRASVASATTMSKASRNKGLTSTNSKAGSEAMAAGEI